METKEEMKPQGLISKIKEKTEDNLEILGTFEDLGLWSGAASSESHNSQLRRNPRSD